MDIVFQHLSLTLCPHILPKKRFKILRMSNLEYLYNFCDIKRMRIFLKLKGEKKKEKEKEACRSHYWDVPQMTNPQ